MALMAERDWDGLGEVTTAGLARYPDDAELNCLKGYQLRKTGNFTGAVDHVTTGIRLDPRPVRYANRAYAYLALGRYDDALRDAGTAISLNASYSTAYGVMATGLLKTGDLAGAEKAVDKALALDPESPVYWHTKGRVLAARGNCTGAREALMASLSINPDYDLPWPGYGNATEDLAGLETTCHAAVPSPTRAVLPPLAAGVAVLAAGAVLGVLSARRR
jgi:tetratricopeptide (TPR) repeat protein